MGRRPIFMCYTIYIILLSIVVPTQVDDERFAS